MAAEVLAALAGGASSIFDKVYGFWRDQVSDNRAERDFDYQKHLQQEIFEREDTAVQRRMADLKAAGLNPNLAAGSAASAGAVVGRSSTPVSMHGGVGNPVGTALDMASAVQQLRSQREQNRILKNQDRETAARADMAENQLLYNNLELYQMLGLTPKLEVGPMGIHAFYDYGDGDWTPGYKTIMGGKKGYGFLSRELNSSNSPIMAQIKYQLDNQKNSAFLLQKDAEYYNTDKIFQYIGEGARSIGNLTGGVGSLGSAYRNFNYINNKRR